MKNHCYYLKFLSKFLRGDQKILFSSGGLRKVAKKEVLEKVDGCVAFLIYM